MRLSTEFLYTERSIILHVSGNTLETLTLKQIQREIRVTQRADTSSVEKLFKKSDIKVQKGRQRGRSNCLQIYEKRIELTLNYKDLNWDQ